MYVRLSTHSLRSRLEGGVEVVLDARLITCDATTSCTYGLIAPVLVWPLLTQRVDLPFPACLEKAYES